MVRDEVLALKSVANLREYYDKNLGCHKYDDNDDQLKECLKKYSLEEFRYMHSIVYSSSGRSGARKVDILRNIDMYFRAIDRAKLLKP